MTQLSMFEPAWQQIKLVDPTVEPVESKRLSAQCHAIIERLKQGDATNDDLAKIARKYTSRVSDCRAAGFVITVVSHDFKTGLTVYRLHNPDHMPS